MDMDRCRKCVKRKLAVLVAAGLCFAATESATASAKRDMSEREMRNARLSMEAATQGMVLLENHDQALPLASGGKVALFGGGAARTVKGGTGSGDVNQRYTVSVWEGLKAAGYEVTTGDWLNAYEEACEKSEAEYTNDLEANIGFTEAEVTRADIAAASEGGVDTAIYVISRISGESSDRTVTEGDYYLSETEQKNLERVADAFERVVVILNVGGVMDTGFFDEIDGLDALLLMSQAGMEGGTALAQVLDGTVTPSGKLTDTWPKEYLDYPSAEHFGANDGDTRTEVYKEGIYVGYRYLDTFHVNPAYEFGYGLSYTDFDIQVDEVQADAQELAVTVTVTNTGEQYSGREVVEIYVSAPDGMLEKPYQELAAYAKTDVLAPGESQTMTVVSLTPELSSYSEELAAWVLEAGTYLVRVGNSSRNTKVAAVLELDKTVVTQQVSHQLVPPGEVEEISKKGIQPYTYDKEEEEIAKAQVIQLDASSFETAINISPYEDERSIAYVSDTTQTEYLAENLPYEPESIYHGAYKEDVVYLDGDFSSATLRDVYDGKVSVEAFVSGLTVSQMADLVIGGNKLAGASGQSKGAASENMKHASDSALAAAQALSVQGAAGETAGLYIEDKKIPNIILADGPAGLRLKQEYEDENGQEYHQFCTAWPIGTMLAQTWDTKLIKEVGAAFGEELMEYGVTILLAPGMNIHRNALCGRNFEYYSEDPYLTGTMGIAQTLGIQSNPGIGACIKHFAANNQEANRRAENNLISERTFREIYLKGFEMAVKGAKPMTIMSSYNRNNGVPAGDDYDLLTDVLRGEWGFEGLVMTDWGGGASTPSISMHAGNDLIMAGKYVEDITVRAFADEEPVFGEDGIYPKIVLKERKGVYTATEKWGEFVLNAKGEDSITRSVPTEVFQRAVCEVPDESGALVTVPVKKMLDELGDCVLLDDNGETTTVIYRGYYKKNNITLGDLQRSVIRILNLILESAQFAGLFDDVETKPYCEEGDERLTVYLRYF